MLLQKRMECFRLLFDHLGWIEHQFLRGIRDSRKAGILCGIMRGVGRVRKSKHHSWLAKGLGLGLLCWGFKGVQQEIPSEEASTLQIGSVVFPPGQCTTTPSLSQTIWARWASRQFLTVPIVETLLPVTFGYSLSSEAVVMRQLKRWKRLWRRSLTRSHVTYWPSTEPSTKRCTCVNKQRNSGNRCIRSKISEYHLDLWTWLNSVQMRTPTGNRWVSNNYITRCHRRLESVRASEFQSQLEIGCPRSENQPLTENLGPSVTPGWAAQPQCERSAAMFRGTWGQYVAVCLRLQLTSHTQPTSDLSNKVW